MPFLCRPALLTLYALLALFCVSIAILLVLVYLQSTTGKTVNNRDCQPKPSVIDFTLPLWKIPVDFVEYELLGHRYSENDCCENESL